MTTLDQEPSSDVLNKLLIEVKINRAATLALMRALEFPPQFTGVRTEVLRRVHAIMTGEIVTGPDDGASPDTFHLYPPELKDALDAFYSDVRRIVGGP